MMRGSWVTMAAAIGTVVLGVVAPGVAGHAATPDAPYYGPMKRWHGIGYEQGFRHDLDKDGSWRIVGATMGHGHAIDIAMYRAAELARDQGYAYVQMLGGSGTRVGGRETVTLHARPSRSPEAPATCRSGRHGTCYTADVAEVLRILGGRNGTEPGVPVTDHVDRYGRAVSYSGFGIGVASLTPRQPASTALTAPPARAVLPSVAERSTPTYEQRLKAQQGVRGRDPQQGWTISD